MMTSPRPRGDVGGSFASRRGHANQLSISDPTHHVTEAIGTLYGDEEDYQGGLHPGIGTERPLSFVGGGPELLLHRKDDPRRHLVRSASDNTSLLSPTSPTNGGHPTLKKSQTLPVQTLGLRANANSYEQNGKAPLSPTFSLRDMDTDSQFSLTDMQGPSDIAQELSNLQALRRLSMDVGNSIDPDIPPFSGMSVMTMPSLAPSGSDDEDDPSRLLWVPARVHPELAPSEFKSFLEKRVNSIKRRSGETYLNPDGSVERGSGSLRRKKSMLSRQIDNSGGKGAVGYVDGADRLGRQRSDSNASIPELSLEELVRDPTGAVQRLAHGGQDGDNSSDDMPILPVAPPGMGLRRSTRTTYRKGSLRGERLPFAKRLAQKQQEQSGDSSEESGAQSPEAPKGHGLVRVQSEPVAENYSRPTRSVRRQQKFEHEPGQGELAFGTGAQDPLTTTTEALPIRTASIDPPQPSLPQIVETAPPAEQSEQQEHVNRPYPQRSSSQKAAQQMQQQQQQQQPFEEPPARSSKRAQPSRQGQPTQPQQAPPMNAHQPQGQAQTVTDMAANPAVLPGGGATRTDSLTFIPTAPPEEKGRKGKKDDDAASVSSTKSSSSWRWFKGSSEEKERKKRDEEAKKAKAKATSASAERPQDNVRLDVLQTFDNSNTGDVKPRGRESLILDRDSLDPRLQEERKKESSRRSDSKKEKDGIFSSLFGGAKKKTEKENTPSKKKEHLRVVEEVPYRPLRPDIDYPYTRFPLLEERAIYRMAHIKLANPRRSLHSQVLLSNFMYSYLAIVQAMHPQMNVPTSPQQRRIEEEARKKEREQQKALEREREQQMAMQQQQQFEEGHDDYGYEYHRGIEQYAQMENGEYDDGQMYDDHGEHHHNGYVYDDQDGGHYDGHHQYDYDDGGDPAQGHAHAHDGRDGRW